MTANGKLDRAGLPDPDAAGAGVEYLAPRTDVEQRIADIWGELLGAVPGIHDRFFQVGGNSIMVIRLISRLQSEFDLELPPRVVFEHPTVAGIAGAIEALIRAEIESLSDDEVIAVATGSGTPHMEGQQA